METKVNGGAIFKNEKKADTHPDYKGTINVDGQDKEDFRALQKDGRTTAR